MGRVNCRKTVDPDEPTLSTLTISGDLAKSIKTLKMLPPTYPLCYPSRSLGTYLVVGTYFINSKEKSKSVHCAWTSPGYICFNFHDQA